LAAKRYRNMLIYGGAGLAAVLGFALITKKNRL
jgi:hypothetical protein